MCPYINRCRYFFPDTIAWGRNSSYTPEVWKTTIIKTILLFNFKSDAGPWRPFKPQAECCAVHTQWGETLLSITQNRLKLWLQTPIGLAGLNPFLNTTDHFFLILTFLNHRNWLPIPADHILFSASTSCSLTCRAQPLESLPLASCGHF